MSAPDPSRQAPLYGEYATPEEVAAATGVPVAPAASVPAAPIAPPAGLPAPAAPAGVEQLPVARRYDRAVTVALLVFGAFSLVQFAPLFLDFAYMLEQATATGPMAEATFGEVAAVGGRVVFSLLLALLVAAVVLAFLALRAGRVAFWIPLTAGIVGFVTIVILFVVVLSQTPGAIPPVN